MSTAKAWIQAARLRTLPLSIAGILAAGALALSTSNFNTGIFIGSLLTAIGFQVLSNFANDYGDGVKGTDNEDRVGPERAMQSGALTAAGLKKGMIFTAVLTFLLSVALIYWAFGAENLPYAILFLVLGLSAIVAAIKYTVGKSAYGYRGLGDVFVFIFFGLVSVLGGYFLYAKALPVQIIYPALSIGLWSTAVLHLNNMRDRESDSKAGKITLAVKLGKRKSTFYHAFLILGGSLAAFLYFFETATENYLAAVPLGAVGILVGHLIRVFKTDDHKKLDPQLKIVALSTFAYALLLLLVNLLA